MTAGSFTLKLKEITIGWTDLEQRDASARLARGAFRPGLGYELVEPIFVLRPPDPRAPDALEREARYRRARDTLDLALYGPGNAEIDTARIDIVRDEDAESGLALVVSVVDRDFWAQ